MNAETKNQLMLRLKSVEGHTRGLQRMVDSEQYCVDILRQVRAVQRALDKITGLLLENHLETCVATAIASDRQGERERVIHELIDLLAGSRVIGIQNTTTHQNEVGCPGKTDICLQAFEEQR